MIFKRVKGCHHVFSSGRIRANANKKIETTGYDPIYKLGVNYEGERVNLGAKILVTGRFAPSRIQQSHRCCQTNEPKNQYSFDGYFLRDN